MDKKSEILFEDLIGPWIGMADDDMSFQRFKNFDASNRQALIEVVRTDILPHYLSMSDEEKNDIIELLPVIKACNIQELNRLWDSVLPPFDLPSDPHAFFAILINELQNSGE